MWLLGEDLDGGILNFYILEVDEVLVLLVVDYFDEEYVKSEWLL